MVFDVKVYKHQYHLDNADRLCAKTRLWRIDNLEKAKQNSKKSVAKYQKTEKSKESNLKRQLRVKFGITVEQYQEILKAQNYSCFICNKHYSEFKQRLAVDHNHTTLEIRGLLCHHCNGKIVASHTKGDWFRMIADYVEGGLGLFVPNNEEALKARQEYYE